MSESLTKQEIFNRVVERLYDGTGRAHDGFTCCYLSPAGNKCAVGIFIPDGHEAQTARGFAWNLFTIYPDLLKIVGEKNLSLLYSLQIVHDTPSNWIGQWPSKRMFAQLIETARHYELNISENILEDKLNDLD